MPALNPRLPHPPRPAARLVLVRHGESEWNREQRFTGWADVGLTADGARQMRDVGRLLADAPLLPDIAFSSTLLRCRTALDILLETMGCQDVAQVFDWRLNERHYGALTGLSKPSAVRAFGAAQVQQWRRGYEAEPPPLDDDANRELAGTAFDGAEPPLPRGESLAQLVARVRPCWEARILPALQGGRTVLVAGHGNSLRALVKIVENIADADIVSLNIPNARALVYEQGAGGALARVQLLDAALQTPSAIL